jgi:AcrR family transcriptional regulator
MTRPGHNRAPHQLPPGRHGLPRAFVISNQRERILDAVMQVVSESGYSAMRIEDVIAAAGVSRRTFYDHFANKEEAFLAAYELVVEQLQGAVGAAYATGDSWPMKVRRGLAAFVTLLAREPALAHVCIVEVLAAGPRALERRTHAMTNFQQFLQPRRGEVPLEPVSPLAAQAVVGGVYEVVYARVVDRRTHELPALLPALLHSVLLPFVGTEVAAAEYRRALLKVPSASPADVTEPAVSPGAPR